MIGAAYILAVCAMGFALEWTVSGEERKAKRQAGARKRGDDSPRRDGLARACRAAEEAYFVERLLATTADTEGLPAPDEDP